MTAHGIQLIQQITFILGRHDPARIFSRNPDAPPDEYESEKRPVWLTTLIEPFYNRRRRHSTLGMLSPADHANGGRPGCRTRYGSTNPRRIA